MIPAGATEVGDEVLSLHGRIDRGWKGKVLRAVAGVFAGAIGAE